MLDCDVESLGLDCDKGGGINPPNPEDDFGGGIKLSVGNVFSGLLISEGADEVGGADVFSVLKSENGGGGI